MLFRWVFASQRRMDFGLGVEVVLRRASISRVLTVARGFCQNTRHTVGAFRLSEATASKVPLMLVVRGMRCVGCGSAAVA
jgi:hypothetical protein